MKDMIKRPGFWLAIFVTFCCAIIGKYLSGFPGLSLIGSLVLALLLGMAAQFIPRLKGACAPGSGFVSNKFIRAGIILLGFKLNLVMLAASGVQNLIFAACIVAVAIIIDYLILFKLLHIDRSLALLVSTGCGICGAAAIMGISHQVKAKSDDAVLAVAVICILGTVFTLIEVGMQAAGVFGLSASQFGTFAGASLHEIAHAVAAGNSGGNEAENAAIITKLSRVLMLAPAAVAVGLFYTKATHTSQEHSQLPIPWFMAGFLLTSVIATFAPLGPEMLKLLVDCAYIILGMAMAALGMNVNFGVIKERGAKVFLGATAGSAIQLLICLAVVHLFF